MNQKLVSEANTFKNMNIIWVTGWKTWILKNIYRSSFLHAWLQQHSSIRLFGILTVSRCLDWRRRQLNTQKPNARVNISSPPFLCTFTESVYFAFSSKMEGLKEPVGSSYVLLTLHLFSPSRKTNLDSLVRGKKKKSLFASSENT